MPMPSTLRGLAKFYQYGNQLATTEALAPVQQRDRTRSGFFAGLQSCHHCYAHAKTNGWFSGTENEIAERRGWLSGRLSTAKMTRACSDGSGWALSFVVRDLGVGTGLVDRAIMLNSNFAEAWRCSGWMKKLARRSETAIEHFARGMRLSPLGRWLVDIQSGIAHAHFFLGRYDEAASWAAIASQGDPDFQAGVRIRAASNAMAGRPEEAHQAVVRCSG